MTIRELIEAAHLDALGLLEDDEQRRFDLAFLAAPEAVQRQVRAEQARVAQSMADQVNAQPPADLKDRVLRAVEEAWAAHADMESDPASETELVGVAGSIGPAGVLATDRDDAGRRVGAWWRAATLGFSAAAAVLLASFLYVANENETLRRGLSGDQTMQRLVQGFTQPSIYRDVAFDPKTRHTIFESAVATSTAPTGRAAIYTNPAWQMALVVTTQLETVEGQSYRMVLVDESNQVIDELREIRPAGPDHVERLDAKLVAPGTRLAIALAPLGQKASAGTVILVAAIRA